jgi:hypothetical protein
MAAVIRSLSSCLDETRIWRSTEQASLEKKPSTRLSQKSCLGVKVNLKQGAGRFPANVPNGPYQISKYVLYAAYTGDPVHHFFQMWQEIDGGKHYKFVWVEETIVTGSDGKPFPAGGFNPMEELSGAELQRWLQTLGILLLKPTKDNAQPHANERSFAAEGRASGQELKIKLRGCPPSLEGLEESLQQQGSRQRRAPRQCASLPRDNQGELSHPGAPTKEKAFFSNAFARWRAHDSNGDEAAWRLKPCPSLLLRLAIVLVDDEFERHRLKLKPQFDRLYSRARGV